MQGLIFIPEKYRWTAYTGHIFVGNLDWLQKISSLIPCNYWHHVFQWYLISSSRVLNRMSITTKDEFSSMKERGVYPSRGKYPLKDSGCTTQLCKWRGKEKFGLERLFTNLLPFMKLSLVFLWPMLDFRSIDFSLFSSFSVNDVIYRTWQ